MFNFGMYMFNFCSLCLIFASLIYVCSIFIGLMFAVYILYVQLCMFIFYMFNF